MELKHICHLFFLVSFLNYQSHHHGIETTQIINHKSKTHAINRTIMELKRALTRSDGSTRTSINRTIMELKRASAFSASNVERCYQSHHHGIETKKPNHFLDLVKSINRTIMELKLKHQAFIDELLKAINRTIMELKLGNCIKPFRH